jgi:hypothetical protein
MPLDPNSIIRFGSDGLVHEVTSVSDSEPVLTKDGWFRSTMRCRLTCDCPQAELENPARFGVAAIPVTCPQCLALDA